MHRTIALKMKIWQALRTSINDMHVRESGTEDSNIRTQIDVEGSTTARKWSEADLRPQDQDVGYEGVRKSYPGVFAQRLWLRP